MKPISEKIAELAEERTDLLDQMEVILEKEGDMTKDDKKKFDDIEKRIKEIDPNIERLKTLEQRKKEEALRNGNPIDPDGGFDGGGLSLDEQNNAEFRNKMGSIIPLLGREEKLQKSQAKLSIGHYMRMLVTGPHNDYEKRAMDSQTSSGGFTIPSITSERWIDLLRARSVVVESGAKVFKFEDTNSLTFAKVSSGPTVSWLAENEPVPTGQPAFTSVVFTPHTLRGTVVMSRELLEDGINIESSLEAQFVSSIAAEIDRVCLYGSGTGAEPEGIKNYTSKQEVNVGGAAMTDYSKLVSAVKKIEAANAGPLTSFIESPGTWEQLQNLADEVSNPLLMPPGIRDIPQRITSVIPETETSGTATGTCSTIIFGNFNHLNLGFRLNTRVELFPLPVERYQSTMLGYVRMDVKPWYEGAFGVIDGVDLA